jgi:glucans biosynthesis protein C
MDKQSLSTVFGSLRAVLALLGIVLHSARVYTKEVWLIHDVIEPLLSPLYQFIHLFRMEGFFLLGGFVLAKLSKDSTQDWFNNRLMRLGVPLVSVFLLLNIPLLSLIQSDFCDSNRQCHLATLGIANGGVLMHLWFLRELWIMTVIALFLLRIRWVKQALSQSSVAFMIGFVPVLVCAKLIVARPAAFDLNPEILELLSNLASYTPFFTLGLAMSFNSALLTSFTSCSKKNVFLALLIGGLTWMLNQAQPVTHSIVVLRTVGTAATAYAIIYLLVNILARAPAIFHWSVKPIANASYTIYLVHHPLVIGLGLLMLQWNMAPLAKFACVASLTFVISMLFHRLCIGRVRMAGLMFSGRWTSHA